MSTPDLPLVFFTLLAQMAVGLAVIAAVRQWAVAEGPPPPANARQEWSAVLVLLVLAVVAAFFHLGHPFGAVHMLSNLGSSWLSREILAFGLFGVLVAVTVVSAFAGRLAGWLVALTALVGVLGVLATGLTYAPPSMPALHNPLPLVFFVLTAAILGPALASFFAGEARQRLLAGILGYSLLVALVVSLVVPFVWLSGDAVARETGHSFLTSWVFWARLVLGLLLPLVLVWRTRRIPTWLPAVLAVTEFAGRLILFALVGATGGHIGLPF